MGRGLGLWVERVNQSYLEEELFIFNRTRCHMVCDKFVIACIFRGYLRLWLLL